MDNIYKKIMRQPVLVHLISAIFVFFVIIFLILKGLNIYTQHNQGIIIPDIKGLLMKDAAAFLENKRLRYTVIDSVYTKEVKPGTIVEVIPAIGSKVKQGRILFITINAFSVQMAEIPDIKDLSLRQGELLVKAQGFTSVEIQYVKGQYKDLIVGIELYGRELEPHEMVPLTSELVLKVGDGGKPEEELPEDMQADENNTSNENG